LLRYSYVDDMLNQRQPYRAEHLERITNAAADGRLLLAGAFAEPVDGAVLVFRAETAADVESWAHADPYFTAGLITDLVVRELTLAVPASI
jgi:uncharacterized protein YciI